MRAVKRIVAALACLAVLLALPFSFGCDRGDDGVEILCTVFPIYDWARSIIGESEGVTLSLLVENGTDMHSFQPSFSDVAKIKRCDVLILVGGESDRWVAEAADEDATVIKLSELEGIRLYEVSAESGGHEHDEEHEHGNGHNHTFDEHLWLSIANARAASGAICEALCDVDGENQDTYKSNLAAYSEKLLALDEKFLELTEGADQTLIFADRFPFVYLFEDYGLRYYAAFEGCTTDVNADFETVVRLAKAADGQSGRWILVTESSDRSLAESVIRAAARDDLEIRALDSMQSLTGEEVSSVATYLGIMESNLEVLKEILK